MKKYKQTGFSIIEILIVIVIIAILVTALTPAYKNYLLKTNRSDAIKSLLQTQILMEKYRINNTNYTTAITDIGGSTDSISGYYTISIPSANTSAYSISAAATGTQTDDTGCTTFTITYANGTTSKTPASCWQ